MWYNSSNSILPEEISRFTIEGDHRPTIEVSVLIYFEAEGSKYSGASGFQTVNEIHGCKTG